MLSQYADLHPGIDNALHKKTVKESKFNPGKPSKSINEAMEEPKSESLKPFKLKIAIIFEQPEFCCTIRSKSFHFSHLAVDCCSDILVVSSTKG